MLLLICCGYPNYDSRGLFVIILFICGDLLNCLENVSPEPWELKMTKTASKSFPQRKCSIQVAILAFNELTALSRRKFHIQAKILTIRPLFPEYLSFFYDNEYREIFKGLRREPMDDKKVFVFISTSQEISSIIFL